MTKKSHCLNKGFTLLEMTVVLGIVAIMTAIVLMNLPQMKGGMSIDVVAQEVAIYIRGAQVYSRATRVTGGVSDDLLKRSEQKPYNSYGINFTSLSDSPYNNRRFLLWADRNGSVDTRGDYSYDAYSQLGSVDTPPQETYDLPSGFTISKLICVKPNPDGVFPVSVLDIAFRLPDPEANFAGLDSKGTGKSCLNATKVSICLQSANQQQWRVIDTYNNGQIAVRQSVITKSINECATP